MGTANTTVDGISKYGLLILSGYNSGAKDHASSEKIMAFNEEDDALTTMSYETVADSIYANTTYIAKSATYTVTVADEIIECTANSFTLDFPSASGIAGKEWTIKNTGVGTITLDANGSETIDGAATIQLTTQYESVTVFSNGTNLLIK